MSRFTAPIDEAARGGAFITVPDSVVDELGGGGRIPVKASFDGVPYRGSVVKMGGSSILGILKSIREQLGKGPGDQVEVIVTRDSDERTVDIPAELADSLRANPEAEAAFHGLSHSHQREHVNHIIEARKPETRQRRADRTVQRLLGSG